MGNERIGLMSLREAMDFLGVSRATFDRWRKEKRLPHIKIGKEIWVDEKQLREWVGLHARVHFAAPPARTRSRIVRVGYQSGAALLWSTLVIKKLGLFEEELRRVSPGEIREVVWHDAPNGMELVEDLIRGDAHIASIGDYPMMAAAQLSRLLPRFNPLLLAFDGKTRPGEGISVVVPSRGPLSGAEPDGEFPLWTVGQSSASARLQDWMAARGSDPSSVVARRTMVDCYYGIVSGRAGASVMWEPYLSWARETRTGVPVFSDGLGDYLTGVMTDAAWAADNEDVVIAYLKAHLRAHAYMRSEPEDAAAIVAEASGVPADLAEQVLSRIRWDASTYGKDVETLLRLGESRTGHEKIFASGRIYLQNAAEALKLPALPDAPLAGEWTRELVY